MPGSTFPPSQAGVLNGPTGLIARLERLERRTVPPTPLGSFEIVFSYAGFLTALVVSPPWYPPRGGSIVAVRVSLPQPATTDHVVELQVNNTAIQQFTLPTGRATIVQASAIELTATSFVTIETVTVSDSDLSVQLTGS